MWDPGLRRSRRLAQPPIAPLRCGEQCVKVRKIYLKQSLKELDFAHEP